MRTFRPTVFVSAAALCAAISTSGTRADIRLPAVVSEGMVLQSNAEVPLWGWAEPGEHVTVKGDFVAGEVSAQADDKGRWHVALKTPASDKTEGNPPDHWVEFTGKNKVTIHGVLIGEVWLCSGQSNMEMGLAAADGGKEEATKANDPFMHLFNVENAINVAPVDDCKGKWTACGATGGPGISSFSAVGYYFAKFLRAELKVPVGVIEADWGGTPAEAWTSAATLKTLPDFAKAIENPPAADKFGPHVPASLFNGMIAPIVPYGIRGAIWYQGESNAGRAFQYRTLFPAMINDWRTQWAKHGWTPDGPRGFSFYFVQIAPFAYGNDRGEAAELREAQTMTLSVPNTGMAVTMDIGDPKDIHPRNKKEVGRRLSLLALNQTYGKSSIVCRGPMYREIKIENGKARLSFQSDVGGLDSGGKPLTSFTIAGEDKKFIEARAEIDGDSVRVWSDSVTKPVAVRFAWGAADEPNLKNKAGLPAPSFRTDDWPGVTQPAPKPATEPGTPGK